MVKNDLVLRKRVGERIRGHRGKASQEDFAAKLKISRGYLSDLERGAKRLSIHKLVEICKRMKTTPSKLLGFFEATRLVARTQAG